MLSHPHTTRYSHVENGINACDVFVDEKTIVGIKIQIGPEYIGYFAAVVPAFAGLLQIPFTFLSKFRYGREVFVCSFLWLVV